MSMFEDLKRGLDETEEYLMEWHIERYRKFLQQLADSEALASHPPTIKPKNPEKNNTIRLRLAIFSLHKSLIYIDSKAGAGGGGRTIYGSNYTIPSR